MYGKWILIAVLILSASPLRAQEFGGKISLSQPTSISEIVENAEALKGIKVQIEGKITEVCAMAGCWIEIESGAGDRIRFKVDDGVIVFPQSVKGQQVTAEGTVEVLAMTRQQYIGWLEHLAEETGKEFDPNSVGDPPYQIVRLRGEGAKITQPAMP